MKKSTKALLYNFLGFALFYMLAYFLIITFTYMTGWWIPVTSAMVSMILAPKFQAIRTSEGEKLFMKWVFVKGFKEVK